MNTLDMDWTTIEERRRLARLRREREETRRTLLTDVMASLQQAEQLRDWIAAMSPRNEKTPEFERMLDWARTELAALETVSDPARLGSHLREHDIFPEVDDLHDPLGEPPAKRPWGR
ncbi:hypothetical protein [Labrys neptuniae]